MYRIRERKERHDKKVSGLFMKRVVFTLILAAFIYTVVAIIVVVRVGAEPSTLTENVFRFLSVEGGATLHSTLFILVHMQTRYIKNFKGGATILCFGKHQDLRTTMQV
jgi:hypothetical protein